MITSNILQRTFHIKYGNCTGTDFSIDLDHKQYLVTAQHVVTGITKEAKIELYYEGVWKQVTVKSIALTRTDVDIAVLAPTQHISPNHELLLSSNDVFLSQDVYFLGFPYGFYTNAGSLNNEFPIPLVKKGIISAFGPQTDYCLIDGHNNPGFSGGPVVFTLPDHRLGVIGVISGFESTQEAIFENNQATNYYYKYNTGIVFAWNIKFAIEAIQANPIGFQLLK